MTERHDRSPVPESDGSFVRRLAEAYRPEPPGPAQRARFDARLRARIERPDRRRFGVPVLAAAVACALAWLVWSGPGATPGGGEASGARVSEVAQAEASTWEAQLLLGEGDVVLVEEDYLPEEYLALASVFLDGP